MGKKLIWIIGILVLLGGGTYLVPQVVSRNRARPLYGNFDIQTHCMGGHEVFLYLDEWDAYENCPGHRDMKRIGEVRRTLNSVTVIFGKTKLPPWRVDYDGKKHTITLLNNGKVFDLPQVNNPWRTELPLYQPED